MASVNKVIIVGNLGRDPELRTFPSGDQIATVSIATTDKWKDKQSGEMKESTEWHRVIFNGRMAEVAGQYLRKGSQVYVEGSLRTRSWEKDGVKQYSTEIRADELKMLGARPDGDQRPAQQPAQRPAQQPERNSYADARGGGAARPAAQPSSGFDDLDSDYPF